MSPTRTIRRLGIANRGEAALRCIRAVKTLRAEEGSELQTLALYTDADRDAPFVRHADLAVALPAPSGDVAAFLDAELLIGALRRAGADAVWPGWGFLAEDPDFARRCRDAGLVFLGPPAEAMRALGDKISAKQIAAAAGVPVAPWSEAALADEADAARWAERIGYPVVLKAAGGGGGRGIRMVESPDALLPAFGSARAEARAAFGDDRVLLEKRIETGRHIEVQLVADEHGEVRSLGCRDCSVQRRHQKVLEEAPPPGLPDARRRAIEDAAVRIAREVGYAGAGTVEFLVTPESFYFLEVNPRLQVEHGITEVITGLDLVQLQIRIARGESIAGLAFEERGVAIEARVCAEDPDAGFLPAPGAIARFAPALGQKVRIDSGVAMGSSVPSAFDSLVAKVIASGANRDEARARLACALTDFELVIQGGATNKGFLLDLLEAPAYRAGGVDTGWLDRFVAERSGRGPFAVEALVSAAILAYQAARRTARLNFFADTSTVAPSRVPPSRGQQIDLTFGGEPYRLRVYAVGSWRYRVHLDGRVAEAVLREELPGGARLEIGGRTLRLLYDATEVALRVEVEGHAHRFGLQTVGQVRAGTPAMVVTIHVEAGETVRAGQTLGVLEAMKMEIGFDAPVSGVVTEVRTRKGQQVAAGEVLLLIDPAAEDGAGAAAERLELVQERDPLSPLFAAAGNGALAEPDLRAADTSPARDRRTALDAAQGEVRRVLLGYDANPERAELLASFLDAPLPDGLSEPFRWALAEVRHELACFADVEQLFIRSPSASISGELGPSNSARLAMYVRRIRAEGAGIAEAFLSLVRQALARYGIHSLAHSDALERAVLRQLASQRSSGLRSRLLLALIQRVTRLAQSGIHLGDDRELEGALARIAGMRGLVSHAAADAAVDASYMIFERPRMERLSERTNKQLEVWLPAAESEPCEPPAGVLRFLADAPRVVFDRVGRWLDAENEGRRAIALAAHLRRIYSPDVPVRQRSALSAGGRFERAEFADGRSVLAAVFPAGEIRAGKRWLEEALAEHRAPGWPPAQALELFVPVPDAARVGDLSGPLWEALAASPVPFRITANFITTSGLDLHRTFTPGPGGMVEDPGFHAIHPETARRVDLDRLANFELERLPASDGIYCFSGRSREIDSDERIFVLADVRGRSPDAGHEVELHLPAFEHAFYESARSLRRILARRDPERRLQWNRITLFVRPEIFLDPSLAQVLARRLAPATRHLGLEKVVVRLRLLDRDAPEQPAEPVEIIISDLTGSNLQIHRRAPHTERLEPRSDYERKVVDARRRRLVYPYEIIRMLTGSGRGPGDGEIGQGVALPTGTFEEYDLDPARDEPVAVSVASRPFGRNVAGVVFGIISTPTEKVPEGMRRVLLLSDPTRGMGSLAAPECDRVVAALDLAERHGLPLEWVPVSSGARIAMESGTENLDATARVVRRIVRFTQAGGAIHLLIQGVNVGAQSYWDSLSTLLMHTRGALIMTPRAAMVLTGRAALAASGSVSAEDEESIGGFERIMGPNGEAQYFAKDLADAYRILYEHYGYTFVVPGESGPRRLATRDPATRSIRDQPCRESEFATVGEIFDDATNPGRKRPFAMRDVMEAVIDRDGGHLERWRAWAGAEMAIVWDAHIGGHPVCLIGIESRNVDRLGYRSADGPESWTGGTLFPLSSKKTARAINAASGNRPVVILANLSGFDGSPESMRKLQLEYGAEIARAVVNFEGPIVFLVVSRYHGGAYVVFSQELNPGLRASALRGSFASVIGGGPAAAVVFTREVRARAAADPRVAEAEKTLRANGDPELRENFDRLLAEVRLETQAAIAAEFDAVHSVDRARRVGSLTSIVEPDAMRPFLVSELEARRS